VKSEESLMLRKNVAELEERLQETQAERESIEAGMQHHIERLER
jgi:hypothetical protein